MADESISSRVARCLLAFDDLRTTLRIDAGQYSKIIQISSISDEQGRFRVWSGNVGAHRTGLNSLNYRLRDASHLHRNVVSLLIDLEQKLRDALDIVTGKRVPWDALSESDSESGSIAAEDEGSEPKSEVEQLFQAVTEIVSCLMRLSLTTTNPAPHDQLSQTPSDASHFEQADIQKVRARFPGAPAFLTKRLGNSITRRREYLKYRQDACKANPQVLSKAPKSRSFFRSRPSQRLNDRGPEIEDKEDLYDSDSSSANDKSPVLITPMPNGFTYGDKFTCPLCLMTIEVSSVKVWNKHVKSDLSPYICTQENCINPTQTFESRNEWFEHELQYHRRRWQCVDGCSESYYDTWSFNAHILQSHEEHFSTTDREKILRLCETQLEGDSSADCDLCGKTQSSLSQLKSHMAKHQEEIAVMALRSEVPPRSATILGRQAPKLQHRQGTKREIKTLFLGTTYR
ncbi:hypothetical protein K505DRAFT_227062 [Melanomma pulvis-pyrius CBS 109.77]|uniref:C2H2-type domain-containing protein n=1 Tax=Melanomma pulvis-pyrius CBS 109.77 TaxID=1314802 RepID=A0A6A6XXC0_9PLEO|nr:hypothetical protein K505DRAFT_227062 [Melanomma pulvis-pyrius CBS 109.77]